MREKYSRACLRWKTTLAGRSVFEAESSYLQLATAVLDFNQPRSPKPACSVSLLSIAPVRAQGSCTAPSTTSPLPGHCPVQPAERRGLGGARRRSGSRQVRCAHTCPFPATGNRQPHRSEMLEIQRHRRLFVLAPVPRERDSAGPARSSCGAR